MAGTIHGREFAGCVVCSHLAEVFAHRCERCRCAISALPEQVEMAQRENLALVCGDCALAILKPGDTVEVRNADG